ncbi:MAG: PH domain-containing protein [Micropruina sp.]
MVYRPMASLRMGISLSVSLVAASLLGWFMTPPHIRAMFTVLQILTLLLFLAIMIGMALGLGLSYVRADDEGLMFRNGVRTRTVPWSQVTAFRYRVHDPWAFVLLRGQPDQYPLMGIQRSDRQRAEEHVADLRSRLEEAYRTEDVRKAAEADESDTDGTDAPS